MNDLDILMAENISIKNKFNTLPVDVIDSSNKQGPIYTIPGTSSNNIYSNPIYSEQKDKMYYIYAYLQSYNSGAKPYISVVSYDLTLPNPVQTTIVSSLSVGDTVTSTITYQNYLNYELYDNDTKLVIILQEQYNGTSYFKYTYQSFVIDLENSTLVSYRDVGTSWYDKTNKEVDEPRSMFKMGGEIYLINNYYYNNTAPYTLKIKQLNKNTYSWSLVAQYTGVFYNSAVNWKYIVENTLYIPRSMLLTNTNYSSYHPEYDLSFNGQQITVLNEFPTDIEYRISMLTGFADGVVYNNIYYKLFISSSNSDDWLRIYKYEDGIWKYIYSEKYFDPGTNITSLTLRNDGQVDNSGTMYCIVVLNQKVYNYRLQLF